MAEWSKAHAWKVCRRGTVSRVRIPLCPPVTTFLSLKIKGLGRFLQFASPRMSPGERGALLVRFARSMQVRLKPSAASIQGTEAP